MLMILYLQREFICSAPFYRAKERSSMREHEGIIKIESVVVKSMDERKNERVAPAIRHFGHTLLYAKTRW
jgi:hypothetical protein